MKVAFMGTPEFALASLDALISSKDHEIGLVITQPDRPKGRGKKIQFSPVKHLALQHGIEVLQPEYLKTNPEILDALMGFNPDAVIVAAYGQMIPKKMLDIPVHGFINVHASLLPSFRGAAPINRAIMQGEKTTGVTIMQIDEGMDSGPVHTRQILQIGEMEDAVSLSRRLSILGAQTLMDTLGPIERGQSTPTPQDPSRATLAPMLKRQEGKIDWSGDPLSIHNMIRGLVPWPCAHTLLSKKTLRILQAEYLFEKHSLTPGTLVSEDKTIKIACTGGFIIPLRLQVEGKKVLDARAFARGLKTDQIMLGY
ncbi:MAG: methionyl-tRNA formyltransferase [Thermodesulfobacteriota bacterium]|nr:methionyl-tRNA formyltransferase [Thermodesulfobacteriota bacterium]